MSQAWKIGAIALGLGLCGCGADPAPPAADESGVPLTVADWQALPPERKYEFETLERLKQADPKLENQREWDRFTKSVILPARRRDVPDGPNPKPNGELNR